MNIFEAEEHESHPRSDLCFLGAKIQYLCSLQKCSSVNYFLVQEAKVAAASGIHPYFSGHIVRDINTDYLDCHENLPTAVLVMKAGNPQKEDYTI